MSTKRELEFLFEVGALRFLPRVWKQFLNPDCQNIPEHTVRVMLMALMIATAEKKGDHAKILKMALLHDLPESRTGDLHYVSKKYATRNEKLALADMVAETPLQKEFTALFAEFEERTSIESKIVKDADNLDVDLELQEQASKGHTLKKLLYGRREKNVLPNLYTATAKRWFRALYKAEPHGWHMSARSIYNPNADK